MNINTLDINKAHLLLEDWMIETGRAPPPPPPRDKGCCLDEDCEGQMVNADFFPYCDTCGLMDTDSPLHHVREADAPYIPKAVLYKRRQYCLEKLYLITGRKQSRSPHYQRMLKDLKAYDFEDLQDLRGWMKQLGYQKFYRFLYNVYHDLKGERLVKLSHNQVDEVARQFVELEWKFKRAAGNTHKRQNMIAYNTMIWFILRQNNVEGYEHLYVPKNHEALVKALEAL